MKFTYPSGVISSEGVFQNNVPHGIWKSYYENGTLKSIGKRVYGILDSTWTFFYSNGKIKEIVEYKNGVKNGYCYQYLLIPTYHLAIKELYIDGLLEGTKTEFHVNGKIEKEVPFKKGKREGESFIYDSLEVPQSIITYRNNKGISFEKIKPGDIFQTDTAYQFSFGNTDSILSSNNKYRIYTIDGLLNDVLEKDSLYKGQYMDGKPIGLHYEFDSIGKPYVFTLYDSVGNKLAIGHIKDLQYNGATKGFFTNGQLKYEGAYSNNMRSNRWKYYYSSGLIEQFGNYLKDVKHGKWVWFYCNGDTLRVETFHMGQLEGLYVSYNENNQIIKKGNYINNLKQDLWFLNTGHVQFEGNYFDDEKDGLWIGFYVDHEYAFKGNYVRGKKNGEHIFYYPNGDIRVIEQYSYDRPVNHWKYYDKTGKLYMIKSYGKKEKIYLIN